MQIQLIVLLQSYNYHYLKIFNFFLVFFSYHHINFNRILKSNIHVVIAIAFTKNVYFIYLDISLNFTNIRNYYTL